MSEDRRSTLGLCIDSETVGRFSGWTTNALSKMKLCELLRDGSANSKVFLRNLKHDFNVGRIAKSTFTTFTKQLESIEFRPGDNAKNIVGGLIKKFPGDYLLRGAKISPTRWDSSELCKFTNGETFLDKNLCQPNGDPLIFDKGTDDTNDRMLEQLLARRSTRSDYFNANSKLRGALEINWVTKRRSLPKISKNQIERLRHILGLTHFNEDQLVCQINYPPNMKLDLHAPTALDGGANYIFKSCNKPGAWGRTRDTENLDQDGLPEAVHKEINFGSDFDAIFLGRLKRTVNEIDIEAIATEAVTEGATQCGVLGCWFNGKRTAV